MIGLVLTCGRNLRPQVCNMLIISWFLMSQFATSNVWKNLSQLFFHCSWSQFATLNYCKLRPQCGVFNSSVATGGFTLFAIWQTRLPNLHFFAFRHSKVTQKGRFVLRHFLFEVK